MIKLELQFETGAECRQALLELLGGTVTTIKGSDLQNSLERSAIKDEKIAENFEAQKTETATEEVPVKKRRTRAEADKAPEKDNAAQESLKSEDIQSEEPANEEPKASAITKEMLQAKAVELIRGGKKDQVTATIKSFDADSISQPDKKPVKVEDYAALMDAFNKIV